MDASVSVEGVAGKLKVSLQTNIVASGLRDIAQGITITNQNKCVKHFAWAPGYVHLPIMMLPLRYKDLDGLTYKCCTQRQHACHSALCAAL